MALRKVVDDQWTSAGVKSTFIIDMPAQPSAEVSSVQTEICGWGWRFSCSIGPESRTASPILLGPDSQAIPWRRVTIHFHPEAIKGASYGRIHFHLEVQHLVELNSEPIPIYEGFDLPDNSWRSEQPRIGAYMKRKNAASPIIAISVQFPANLGISLPAPRDARVDAALADTLHGEEITDVKFYSYTRVGPGYVSHPRPLFAKLALLEGRSGALDAYLSAVFAEGFKESELVDLDRDTPVEERFADYDYMSDSDLDADDEDEATRRSEYSLRARDFESLPSPSRPGSPANTDYPVSRQMGRMIDLDADDEDEATQRSKYSLQPRDIPLPSSCPDSPANIDYLLDVARRMGRVIVVKGFAFRTWNAFLYYLYTNQIEFRKLGSSGRLGSASKTPKCSAKSMYKLAEAFGLEDLKSLAFSSLRSQLSSENVVRETFSTFTSLFAEIQDIEVDLLLKKIPELTRNGDLEVMLRGVCDGARPQCYDVLRKIVRGRAN
ncbi:hypothetical protein GGX14DRAFT_694402 [Mycena pura]|uniref:Uncharacterized protein n=1 Tax=Mycena pura TaxID=153505 RepID=A0AAD6YMB4_9AGAR|nr:hypothetical protein GGX14DRAFT_694402 [Mycena pura]